MIIFQSTLPAWGETTCDKYQTNAIYKFQSTLPAWGETRDAFICHVTRIISIHSPRMGRDLSPPAAFVALVISIHSPRMGRDGRPTRACLARCRFQSTLPAWGETWGM